MTNWTTLSDTTLSQDKPLTQSVARALRDNPVSIAEAAAGAPSVCYLLHHANYYKNGTGGILGGGAADGYFNPDVAITAGDHVLHKIMDKAVATTGTLTNFSSFRVAKAGTYRVKYLISGNNALGVYTFVGGVQVDFATDNSSPYELTYSYDFTTTVDDELVELKVSRSGGTNGNATISTGYIGVTPNVARKPPVNTVVE